MHCKQCSIARHPNVKIVNGQNSRCPKQKFSPSAALCSAPCVKAALRAGPFGSHCFSKTHTMRGPANLFVWAWLVGRRLIERAVRCVGAWEGFCHGALGEPTLELTCWPDTNTIKCGAHSCPGGPGPGCWRVACIGSPTYSHTNTEVDFSTMGLWDSAQDAIRGD